MTVQASPLDVKLGMEVYASSTPGIGGKIRSKLEDFIVEEVLLDGSKASINLRGDKCRISGRGRYLICILIKRGWDTLSVIEKIARQIGVSPEMIGVAGIKDAQALTAQHLSIGAIRPEKIKTNLRGVYLIPMRFSEEKISTRILMGNQFNITVRSILYGSLETHQMIIDTWREISSLGGVPNFFGHQRFGTIRPITHMVGRFILKERFEEAAMLFLSEPSEHESPQARNAREYLRETMDFRSALKRFPKGLFYERLMLRYLSRYPRDFLGAFRRLPIRLRRLFVQAYQSYLFNRFLSERMKRKISLIHLQRGDYAVNIGAKGLPIDGFTKVDGENLRSVSSKVEEGSMALALPVVGFDQQLSSGVQGEIEREILEQEGIQPQDFQIEKMPESSMRGGLRKALASVMNLSFKTTSSDGETAAEFRFMLHKGSYATVVLREFMKPEDPASSGF
ncbi:tRNA pseudouridine(13) synthase TruD [Candidatus Bathyarchaeota archaeon]|nr:MAG: tRNA pseudouridine(13) synthase TruD [Candidatus Bathyarchaeota archaeon]